MSRTILLAALMCASLSAGNANGIGDCVAGSEASSSCAAELVKEVADDATLLQSKVGMVKDNADAEGSDSEGSNEDDGEAEASEDEEGEESDDKKDADAEETDEDEEGNVDADEDVASLASDTAETEETTANKAENFKPKSRFDPKSGSPTSCSCKPVTLKGKYSAGALIQCMKCLDVKRSTDQNSCPEGTKLWMPASRQDWKTFVVSASYLRAPSMIVDITRPKDGCGGCSRHAMNSGNTKQKTWRTSDGAPWWLRSTTYSEPNGDYLRNSYMDIWHAPKLENGGSDITFNDEGNYKYHAKSYYCQPKFYQETGKSLALRGISCNDGTQILEEKLDEKFRCTNYSHPMYPKVLPPTWCKKADCQDTANGKTDLHGDGCGIYEYDPNQVNYCGKSDGQSGFKSNEMCCACGGGTTKANTCFCPNGKPAQGADCTADQSTTCASCNIGFSGTTCKANTCFCPNGKPAEGADCTADQSTTCASCNIGFSGTTCKAAYTLGVVNTNTECPSGSVEIQDEGVCRAAAASLGIAWASVGSWGNNAKGCIKANGNNAYLNTHPSGVAVSTTFPICNKAFEMLANNKYCPTGFDVETQAECQAAATALGKTWGSAWNGPKDHRYCLFADDKRQRVYFNTADKKQAASKPPNSKYASVCHEDR